MVVQGSMSNGRPVAIKFFSAGRSDAVSEAGLEAERAMTLRHSVVGPGWVTLLGQNITRGFLVYELVEEGSLV